MTNPVIHATTRKQLEVVRLKQPQAILLTGLKGVGLQTIARWMAAEQLSSIIRPQDAKEQEDSDSGTVSVETIRRLYEQTRTKQRSRRVIIIDDADRMSQAAQNAFLKLLEEPNSTTYFILTSHSPQNLLPTVRSRTQASIIQPITKEQTGEFLSALGIIDSTKRTQLQFIGTGLPAELTRLASDNDYFADRAKIMGDARQFLQADTYAKLLVIAAYKSDRQKALQLIDSALQILRRTLSTSAQTQIIAQLDRLLVVRERISANHNIPLQLTHFVV